MTDYICVGKVVPERVSQIVKGIAEGCVLAGCALVGGETAEHPGLLGPDEYDVAGAGTGVVEADAVLGADRIRTGDAVIAMASSGLHSNGYSLVRHVLFERAGWALERHVPELGRTLGEELLEPTKIYSLDCLALARTSEVHAFAHITGGGLPATSPASCPRNCTRGVDRGTWSPGRCSTWSPRRRRRARRVGEHAQHGRRHGRGRPAGLRRRRRWRRWSSVESTPGWRGRSPSGSRHRGGDPHRGSCALTAPRPAATEGTRAYGSLPPEQHRTRSGISRTGQESVDVSPDAVAPRNRRTRRPPRRCTCPRTVRTGRRQLIVLEAVAVRRLVRRRCAQLLSQAR